MITAMLRFRWFRARSSLIVPCLIGMEVDIYFLSSRNPSFMVIKPPFPVRKMRCGWRICRDLGDGCRWTRLSLGSGLPGCRPSGEGEGEDEDEDEGEGENILPFLTTDKLGSGCWQGSDWSVDPTISTRLRASVGGK